jgi:hypothetical protein
MVMGTILGINGWHNSYTLWTESAAVQLEYSSDSAGTQSCPNPLGWPREPIIWMKLKAS